MPPDPNALLGNVALSFMGIALLAIIGIGWGTRELVTKIHGTISNKQSGIDAIWGAINALRRDFRALERERHESPRPNSHG